MNRWCNQSLDMARKREVNMSGFSKLRKAIEKAEKIYELAGGKKQNLKKAILTGKGNELSSIGEMTYLTHRSLVIVILQTT